MIAGYDKGRYISKAKIHMQFLNPMWGIILLLLRERRTILINT